MRLFNPSTTTARYLVRRKPWITNAYVRRLLLQDVAEINYQVPSSRDQSLTGEKTSTRKYMKSGDVINNYKRITGISITCLQLDYTTQVRASSNSHDTHPGKKRITVYNLVGTHQSNPFHPFKSSCAITITRAYKCLRTYPLINR